MHPHIKKLYQLSNKDSRLIIGLMSGTSVDGLDVALCEIHGSALDTSIELIEFETVNYNTRFKNHVKSIFSKKTVDLERLCLLNGWIGEQHAAMILDCLKKWKVDVRDVDLIASHGQTIFHAPKTIHNKPEFENATLQIGDGDHIACRTGIITISDFRQKHIAAGGEGAPLAVYGDYLILSSKEENRILLNLGGIANFTYLPKSLDTTSVFSTDTGPGNTLMDAYVQKHFEGKYYDDNALIALSGTINWDLLKALKDHLFFDQSVPKTTGPELFNLQYVDQALSRVAMPDVSHEDIVATLSRFSADTIVGALKDFLPHQTDYSIYVSGGGIYNPLLMTNISMQLPDISILSTEKLAINPDAKEAILFAILANECVAGGKEQFGNGSLGIPNVSMGKISFPD